MKLNEFLITNGITMANFADAVGTTTATISRVAVGLVVPRKALLTRRHRWSGDAKRFFGAVLHDTMCRRSIRCDAM